MPIAMTKVTLAFLIGALAVAMTTSGCREDNRRRPGSGGSSAGGSGSGGSGGNESGGAGGNESGGAGGNGSGGDASGGAGGGASGGAGGSGGEQSGGSGSGGSGGEQSGGNGGSASGGAGNGGTNGSGGVVSCGGAPPSDPALSCSSPIVPSNGSEGGITDFADYSTCTGKWGSPSGLYGSVYGYDGTSGSTIKATVDASAKLLRLAGSVSSGDYAGGGLDFKVCTTVEAMKSVQYTLGGTAPGCEMEFQIKTFDQQPVEQGGGCKRDTSTTCYAFPVVKAVTIPSSPSDVTHTLADVSSWSTANAKQVIGLQWHFTGSKLDGDAGQTCPVDVTVTNIKLAP